MKNKYLFLGIATSISVISTGAFAQRLSAMTARRSVAVSNNSVVADDQPSGQSCLDAICMSPFAPEKGKCRCSGAITKYNTIEQKITDIENEIAERNRQTSLTNSQVDGGKINSKVAGLYEGLNETQKKNSAKGSLASEKEGDELIQAAFEKCGYHGDKDNQEMYMNLVNQDCDKYSDQINQRLEMASSSLAATINNQKLAEDNKYKQNNQLSASACFSEFEGCAKLDCGSDFLKCPTSELVNKSLDSCADKLIGKCDDIKNDVMDKVRNDIPKQRAVARRKIAAQAALDKQNALDKGKTNTIR